MHTCGDNQKKAYMWGYSDEGIHVEIFRRRHTCGVIQMKAYIWGYSDEDIHVRAYMLGYSDEGRM